MAGIVLVLIKGGDGVPLCVVCFRIGGVVGGSFAIEVWSESGWFVVNVTKPDGKGGCQVQNGVWVAARN